MRYWTEDVSKNMTESITSYIGKLEKSIIKEQGTMSPRDSEVSWIKNQAVLKSFFEYVSVINDTIWKYKLTDIEPLQYTRYNKEQYYNWHIDEHSEPYANGLIRKLSFTIFLNESRPRSPDCSKILIDFPISSEIPQLNPCDLAERFTVVSIS